jgi:heme-degrading monooxygenase HmoA
MSTRIMIERKFKNPITSDILRIIDEIRVKALRQRGYVGGETVVNADDDRDVLVISSWASVNDWEAWYETKDWKDYEKELAPHLDGPVELTVFIPRADYEKKLPAKPIRAIK